MEKPSRHPNACYKDTCPNMRQPNSYWCSPACEEWYWGPPKTSMDLEGMQKRVRQWAHGSTIRNAQKQLPKGQNVLEIFGDLPIDRTSTKSDNESYDHDK